MKLQTPVTDQPCNVGISYNDKILMLGSCFADNIGNRMQDYGFDVLVNPFGTLYNPESILGSIQRMASGEHFISGDCVQMGAGSELICSFSHHTSFARRTQGEFLSNANDALDRAAAFFRQCNKIIITLGTSWCYRHRESGKIVSNCLKRPGGEFTRERLSVTQIVDCLDDMIKICDGAGIAPKEFIFTVSPIRHLADGAHGNQLSKSSLLLGIQDVLGKGRDYFPSYEIMMDELRDYRFYAEDMCHPTRQAEEYIFERFTLWALPEKERGRLREHIRAFRQSQHIPMSEN